MSPTTAPTETSVLRRSVAALVCLVALVASLVAGQGRAVAADLTRFDPGHIITDRNFYDSGSMSVDQVATFIATKGARCRTGADGTPCLRDFRMDTPSRPADDRCARPYTGRADQTAAQIIVGVAQACGINPRVILVMLQKEQGLVTSTSPRASMYAKAMGFACPDTAPCDPTYAGFFSQVHRAAWRLNDYALNPTRFAHRAGVVNNVRFHPDTACGSAPVLIRNQATASLYNYTPYQPNAAALAAGYGEGDACSAYGNRNFYSYYTDWFGIPTGVPPIGVVDSTSADNTSITLSGWALDPDTTSPIDVHVYVDGAGYSRPADLVRPDVAAIYGGGDRHGFRVTLPSTPGAHEVCTFAINDDAGANTLLDCRIITVPDRVPFGVVDSVTATADSITVSGWTVDPDTVAPTDVHVYVDGVGASVRADRPRPDVGRAYGRGDAHGYTHTRAVEPGPHEVCVFAINTVASSNTLLLCRTVVAETTTAAPFGVIDAVTPSATGVTVSGWTIDPDTDQPTDVRVEIDGVVGSVRADRPRPDVAAAYGRGERHGYLYATPVPPGRHRVCVTAVNTLGVPNTPLGCRDVTVVNAAPIGAIDSVTTAAGQLTVSGWTLDPDTSEPVQAHVYIDGVGASVRADGSRPDVGRVYGRGDRHGFTHTRTLTAGDHRVCVFGIDVAGSPNTLLGCRDVVVPA